MRKPKVFVSRQIPDQGLSIVVEHCEAEIWQKELPPDQDMLRKKVQGIEGLLCLLTDKVDEEIMDAAGQQIKVISNLAVGYDNIDINAATKRNIAVGNTPGVLTNATADFTWALLLAAARKINEADKYVRAGLWKTWHPTLLLGSDLSGSTLGIIGFGRIGKAVAKRAAGFGMRIIAYDPHPDLNMMEKLNAIPVDFSTLLRESDFITIHANLNQNTRNLINANAFSLMKSNCILINTARGAIVDPEALYHALSSGQIAAAGLDVTDPEPIPHNSPLLDLNNLVFAPHIASSSKRTRDNMALMAANNLIAGVFGDHLPNCVNPEIYVDT